LQTSVEIGRRPFCRTFSRLRHSVPREFLTSRKWSLDRWLVGSLAGGPTPSNHVFGPRTRPLGSFEALLISLRTSRTHKSLQQKESFRIPLITVSVNKEPSSLAAHSGRRFQSQQRNKPKFPSAPPESRLFPILTP
jgi:hypothetical protein